MKFTAKQIADYLGGTVIGDEATSVSTFAKIEEGKEGAISFLANPKYAHYLYTTASSIVLINADFEPQESVLTTLIKVPNAYESIAKLLKLYEAQTQARQGIDARAYISPTAIIGENCYVAPFVYIGDDVRIGNNCQIYAHCVIEQGAVLGDNCLLYPHVTIYHQCHIGHRVIIHAGAVIGADGFGFAPSAQGYEKIPQIGIVEIGDDVEIGANACVDRSTMGSTRIHAGVKIDNLVQLAHNVEIGSHTVISAQTGIAGSTKVGSWCMFGGQVGIAGHLTIGDKVYCGAQAGVAGSFPQGNVSIQGTPAIPHATFARASVLYKRLPELYAQLQALTKEQETNKKEK